MSDHITRLRERKAFSVAVCEEINSRLERGPLGNVDCSECKASEWVGGMFRCFFCLAYFCQTCAEKHFGMTREEYWKQKGESHGR